MRTVATKVTMIDDDHKATAPSITTSVANALVLAFYTNKKDATWTPATGTTEVYDSPNTQQGLTSNMMAYYINTTAGATGSKTAKASKEDGLGCSTNCDQAGTKQIWLIFRKKQHADCQQHSG